WGQAGVPGGIPARTNICKTLGAPGHPESFVQNVDTSDIQAALTACSAMFPTAAGSVVLLEPGTYQIKTTPGFYMPSYVTLRGSGPTQTTLIDMAQATTDIYFTADGNPLPGNNSSVVSGNVADWTAGYAAGTTQITLSKVLPQSMVGEMLH